MSTVYNQVRDNYCIVPNRIINDREASVQAKMIYIYMVSKPDDWEYNLEDIGKNLGLSRQTVRKHMDDLVSLGWVTDLGQQKRNGRFASCIFIVNDLMTKEELTVLNSTVLNNSATEELNITNNREYTKERRKKRNNIIKKDVVKILTWKEDYEEYVLLVDDAESRLVSDDVYRAKYESWYENIDYVKTVMKTSDWWRSTVGWEYCKKKRVASLDLYMSLRNNLDRNRIYKSFKALSTDDKVKSMDEQLELFKMARNNK